MSDWATERWEAELWLDPQWVVVTTGKPSIVLCVTSHGDDEAKAKGIVSDHNACLGIEDPVTTVPGLLAFVEGIANGEHVGSCFAESGEDCTCNVEEAKALIAKTKGRDGFQ